MPCICGDTACSSCGPAQGYNLEREAYFDMLYGLFDDTPTAIDREWLITYVGEMLEKETAKQVVIKLYNYHNDKGNE